MSTDNFGPASVPPPAPGYGAAPTPPPVPGYGQSSPPPAPTPSYGQTSAPYAQPADQYPTTPYPTAPGPLPTPYGINPGGPFPPLAEWPQRALGALIDWGIPMVVSMIGGVIGGLIGSIFSLAALAAMIYNTGYLAGTTGYSYGRKIAGTKLVSEKTLQPIGFGMAVGRYFVHCLDGAILMIGFLFPLFTPKKQTIADMLMGTLVLDEKKMQ